MGPRQIGSNRRLLQRSEIRTRADHQVHQCTNRSAIWYTLHRFVVLAAFFAHMRRQLEHGIL